MVAIAGDDVHVWFIRPDVPAALGSQLERLLSGDERVRAGRFATDRLRGRFVARRAALRQILAAYLETEPGEIAFAHGPHGKPELAGGGTADIRFNLARTDSLAMVAIAWRRAVGVDVERIRPVDVVGIVRRYFTAAERDALDALPEERRLAAFYDCWTRKEAYLKARGEGLTAGLDRITIGFPPYGPAGCDVGDWSLRELAVDEGYAAAIAVAGPSPRLSRRQWRPGG